MSDEEGKVRRERKRTQDDGERKEGEGEQSEREEGREKECVCVHMCVCMLMKSAVLSSLPLKEIGLALLWERTLRNADDGL